MCVLIAANVVRVVCVCICVCMCVYVCVCVCGRILHCFTLCSNILKVLLSGLLETLTGYVPMAEEANDGACMA